MTGHAAPATAGRPLRRDAERNRQRILEAARELFAEAGLEVTLDDVAHRAGVGVGTVYRRFANKELLIDALFEDRIDEIAALAQAAVDDPDPWRGFVSFIETAADAHCADRGLQQVVFSSAHGRDRVEHARERIKPLLRRVVERAQAEGSLRPDVELNDVPLVQFMIGAAAAYSSEVAPGAWRRQLTIVLDGLRTARRAPTPLPSAALTDAQFDEAMRTAKLP